MHDIRKAMEAYKDDMESANNYCEELYQAYFADKFRKLREMQARMKSTVRPITDEELEYILTEFPMELFSVAELLNKLRLQVEVIKLNNKEQIESIKSQMKEEGAQLELTKTEIQECINQRIASQMLEFEVLLSVHNTVISRVENEQTFSKELIMGAKKVWDSRRSAENSNPVKEVIPDLPEYDITANKQYVK